MSPIPFAGPIRAHRGTSAGLVRALFLLSVLPLFSTGCGSAGRPQSDGSIRLFNAASIARPLRILADSFTARTGVTVVQESQSSLELARRLTEFNDNPDVLALADWRVFPALLSPRWVDGWWLFAHNRLVLGYTSKSRYQDKLGDDGWRFVLMRPGVEVGRSDPNTDPSGYRTLLAFQLAELHYGEVGLAARLLESASERNVRPREADQVAMLQAGTLDYIWTYENLARGAGLHYVTLPSTIDLGSPADSAFYARASVRVVGRQKGDSVTFRGEPILYGVAIPKDAEQAAEAQRFVDFMLGADGQRILRAASLNALDQPIPSGNVKVP